MDENKLDDIFSKLSKEEKNNLSLEHFIDLLNKINGGVDNNIFAEKETFRLQVLLLHLYVDYLLIEIIKEDLKLHKEMISKSEGFSQRLHIIHAKGIIDDNGFKALKRLNSIRNDLQHKYEFDIDVMKSKIEDLKNLSPIKDEILKFNIISQLELICVHYINSLRGYLESKRGEEKKKIIVYQLKKDVGTIIFSLAPVIIERKERTEKEIFDYAKDLIACAELDFKSAKYLCSTEEKVYAIILYHIQQSVEKLSKAELILRKQLDIDELRKVNHRTPNAFMMSLDKAKKDEKIGSFLEPHLNESALQRAKGFVKNPEEIIASDKETLLKTLNYYDDIFKPFGIADIMFQQALNSPIADIVDKNSEERRDVYMRLFFLSWITFFFAEETRYPDGKIKPFEYNELNSFVQIIPDLLEKIEKVLVTMNSYKFKEEKSNNLEPSQDEQNDGNSQED